MGRARTGGPLRNLADVWQTLSDFMGYCNITQPPRIQRGLFT